MSIVFKIVVLVRLRHILGLKIIKIVSKVMYALHKTFPIKLVRVRNFAQVRLKQQYLQSSKLELLTLKSFSINLSFFFNFTIVLETLLLIIKFNSVLLIRRI